MIRVAYTDHLVDLIGRAEAAAARIAPPCCADPARREALAADARREAARLSARLDGSPLEDATAAEVDAGEWQRPGAGSGAGAESAEGAEASNAGGAGQPAGGAGRRGGWADALRVDDLPTQEVAAVEYANLLACFDAEADVAGWFFERPLEALRTLHGHVGQGLVGPEHLGTPRQTHQAVHDGAQGRVIYHAPDPEAVPVLLDGLAEWLAGPRLTGSAALPALVVAGVVHERILEWQPFEAANGRVARSASRVVLRARGLDPDGLAVVERGLALDPLGYHAEVAATIRRGGDLGPWLERYGEAAVAALEHAAGVLAPDARPSPSPRALSFVRELGEGAVLTLAECVTALGGGADAARTQVRALTTGGWLRELPGSRGLRFQAARRP